jgi:hypothetical protein
MEVAFTAGERAKIAVEGVKLMRGHKTIVTLDRGQEIIILQVQDRWLGTSIEIRGETKLGWVAAGNVVAVADSPAPVSKP